MQGTVKVKVNSLHALSWVNVIVIWTCWEGLLKTFLNNCRSQGHQVKQLQIQVLLMCHHFIKVCKKTTKLSSSDERKLIGVHPENRRVTKAQACHKWEITGTPASLSTVERVLYNLEWERADQESLKLTKICRYPHGQIKVKSSEEKVSCFTWDKNKDTIVTMTRDMFEGVKMRLSNLYQHCNNWW